MLTEIKSRKKIFFTKHSDIIIAKIDQHLEEL